MNEVWSALRDLFALQLACRLPARVQGYPWRLAYSTVKHGTSLKTLYRNLQDVDSPVLLVVKDMDNQVGQDVNDGGGILVKQMQRDVYSLSCRCFQICECVWRHLVVILEITL